MFLWYIVLRQDLSEIGDLIGFFPKEYTALFVWIVFLGYIFFPSKRYFNPQGRLYTFKLLEEIVRSPFHPVTFRVSLYYHFLNIQINWATDQLASFVLPLKDFEYVICYYITNRNDTDHCTISSRFSSAVLMAFIPLALRIV